MTELRPVRVMLLDHYDAHVWHMDNSTAVTQLICLIMIAHDRNVTVCIVCTSRGYSTRRLDCLGRRGWLTAALHEDGTDLRVQILDMCRPGPPGMELLTSRTHQRGKVGARPKAGWLVGGPDAGPLHAQLATVSFFLGTSHLMFSSPPRLCHVMRAFRLSSPRRSVQKKRVPVVAGGSNDGVPADYVHDDDHGIVNACRGLRLSCANRSA
jgi:hypothetical protein